MRRKHVIEHGETKPDLPDFLQVFLAVLQKAARLREGESVVLSTSETDVHIPQVLVIFLALFYTLLLALAIFITPSRISQFLYDRAHELSTHRFGWMVAVSFIGTGLSGFLMNKFFFNPTTPSLLLISASYRSYHVVDLVRICVWHERVSHRLTRIIVWVLPGFLDHALAVQQKNSFVDHEK
jgi:hypothetical protein